MRKKNILICGEPGIGKTTVFRSLVEHHPDKVAGIITEEVLDERSSRIGFRIRDLLTEETMVLASLQEGAPRVGKYHVHVEALEGLAMHAIERALFKGHIVCIDEIAQMQMLSHAFQGLVRTVLNSKKIVLATIQSRLHPFSNEIRRRKDVTLYVVHRMNRGTITTRIETELLQVVHSY